MSLAWGVWARGIGGTIETSDVHIDRLGQSVGFTGFVCLDPPSTLYDTLNTYY